MTKQTKAADSTLPKIKIGWFSFSCCEDNTAIFTELLNDHWKEWREIFDFRHVRALKSNNIFDEFDIAFIEGAVTTEEQEKRIKEIRERATTVIAVGACAVVGLPAGQRNTFSTCQKQQIDFLLARFKELPKVLKVADVIKVDASVPGCPMDEKIFMDIVTKYINNFFESHKT